MSRKDVSTIQIVSVVLIIIAIIVSGVSYGNTAGLDRKIGEMSGKIEGLDDTIGELTSAELELASTMKDLGEAIGEYGETITAIEERLKELEEEEEELPIEEVVLRLGVVEHTENIDPSIFYTTGPNRVIRGVYETLLKHEDPDISKLTLVLAESYEHNEDYTEWTFYLRDDVTFHDGTPFDALAVIFSYDRTITIGMGGAWILDPIERVEEVGTYTVRFILKWSVANWDYIMASPFGNCIMSPTAVKEHQLDEVEMAQEWLSEHECGTGPYILESFTPLTEVVLVKYPDYWRGWEGSHVDKVIITRIPELATQRMMLEVGDIDIAPEMAWEDMEVLMDNPDIVVHEDWSLTNYFNVFNNEEPPLDDKLVRQAISYVFDYDAMTEDLLLGHAIQCQGPIPRALSPWFNPDIPIYTKNNTKALELLEQAGYTVDWDGEKVTDFPILDMYMAQGVDVQRKAGELLQSNLDEIGITLRLTTLTWAEAFAPWDDLPPGEQDVHMVPLYWYPDYNDPISWFYGMFYSSNLLALGGFNMAFYNNSYVDALMDEYMTSTDMTRLVEISHELQEIFVEDAAYLYMWEETEACAMRSWVKGYVWCPMHKDSYDFYAIHIES